MTSLIPAPTGDKLCDILHVLCRAGQGGGFVSFAIILFSTPDRDPIPWLQLSALVGFMLGWTILMIAILIGVKAICVLRERHINRH